MIVIRELGSHLGKQVIFGYDRYLLPELDAYTSALAEYGIPVPAVVRDNLHYLTSAQHVAERVKGRKDAVGVLLCSSGMGMSIAANKFRGIYAARCLTVEDAQLARQVNNANVLCLAIRSSLDMNRDIIEAFMTTPYEGRKLDQLQYITSMELERDPAPARLARVKRA